MPPQLATLVEAAPEGDDWLHEVKFDGYRLQALVAGTTVKLLTRSGKDWTARFPGVATWLGQRAWRSTALDGELVTLDDRGRSDFQRLQSRLADGIVPDAVLMVFDLLCNGGIPLLDEPLVERKRRLRKLLGRASATAPVRFSTHRVGHGSAAHDEACRDGLEGIIAKLGTAPYRSGRSRSWLKLKCIAQQEFVVVGFTPPKGSREKIGALLLAARDDAGRLRYAGRVGAGLSDALLTQLHARLARVQRASPPLSPAPPAPVGTVWVRPTVVVEVRFTEWTSSGLLRHPTFLGLREDKMARQVMRESPVDAIPGLTHPDKVLYPDQGITKRDLALYYQKVAPLMLPHVADRPLALVRCPEGSTGSCFFQKHLSSGSASALRRVSIRQSDGVRIYGVVDDMDGLLAAVQMGVLEVHVWGARADRVDRPDRIVIDLDPGTGVTWAALCEAARSVRELLTHTGLESWVKTSGGKGIHVVAPIERRSTWEEAAEFTHSIARALEEHAPDRYLSRATRAARPGKIFVDWLRNTRGATAVGAWSTRARAGAPVSRPCDWSELEGLGRSDGLTVGNVLERPLPYKRDPWRDLLTTRQRLRTLR